QPMNQTFDEAPHSGLGKRLEVDRGRPPPGAEARSRFCELRAGQHDDEDGEMCAFVEVIDEREQTAVGVLHVLEDEYDGVVASDPLEERRPRREEVLPRERIALAVETEQRAEPRREPLPFT